MRDRGPGFPLVEQDLQDALLDVLVPGHGAVARGPEIAARLAADRAYLDAVRRGETPTDPRLEQDWLSGPHQSNLAQAQQTV